MAQTFDTCHQNVALLMLRAIIGDLDSACEDYTDAQLQQILLASTRIVFGENKRISNEYTLDIGCLNDSLTYDISPAPSDLVISMIVMKAACMLQLAELKIAASLEGIRAKCGSVEMSQLRGSAAWALLMVKGPCDSYKSLKEELNFRQPIEEGEYFKAILRPYIEYKTCEENSKGKQV